MSVKEERTAAARGGRSLTRVGGGAVQHVRVVEHEVAAELGPHEKAHRRVALVLCADAVAEDVSRRHLEVMHDLVVAVPNDVAAYPSHTPTQRVSLRPS